MKVGLRPGHIVLDEDTAPLPKMGQSRQFSAHLYCGQTAGCIKMPLGMEVGLSPGDIVLDGDPTTNFWPMSILAKRRKPIFHQSLLKYVKMYINH